MKENTDAIDLGETVQSFSGGQKLLNRYKLNRVLGQGGMGVVWLARDEELERDIALKFLPAIVVNDRASLADLKRETRRSLELTHPNIVRTYDFVQDSTIAGISMEYVECDTLRNRRVDQPGGVFEPGQLGEWVKQLCGALDYAHTEAEIVHRDLKPANLMINRRDHLKVADFGISRSLVESVTQMTMQRGVSGTLVYMSPQQLLGDTASPLDDVYAVGATLYELLTTRPPFYTGDISAQVHGRIPPTMRERRGSLGVSGGEIPSNWEAVIASCLSKDAAQRPKSAGEIAARLGLIPFAEAALQETMLSEPIVPARAQPIILTPSGPASSTAPASFLPPPPTAANLSATVFPAAEPIAPRRRNPATLAAAALALLTLTAGASWYLASYLPKQRAEQARIESATESKRLAEQAQTAEKARQQATADAARAEAERLASVRGSIVVKTEPAGAIVKIGDFLPAKSPAVFHDLKLGKQTVQITLEGYDPLNLPAEIKENSPTDLGSIALVRSKGSLNIVSVPDSLPYELRSRANPLNSTRGVTPLSATDMLTGDYDITVTREGWKPVKQTVTVAKDQEPRAAFEFLGGSVVIDSKPPGAKVTAGTKELGVTPLPLTDLIPGDVEYTVALAGYDSAKLKGTIEPGQELPPLTAELHKTVAKKVAARTSGPTHSTTTRKKSGDEEEDSSSSGHNHTGEILRGIFGGGGGFRPGFPGRPF